MEFKVKETVPKQNGRPMTRVHGGNIREAIKRYGLEERMVLDFSSNVNPLGPSPAAKQAVKDSISFLTRYPDPEMVELRTAIARYVGVKPEQVACGNGSNGLIHLIPRVFKPKKVLIPVPTFSEYAAAAEAAGAEVIPLPLPEHGGFRLDPIDMAFALKGVDMAFLCNPNNPTGRLIPKPEMIEIARYAVQEGVRLIVDEAFIDFIEADSLVKETALSSHLICLRAFTKFFGLPGLRIGYAVSSEDIAAALRDSQEPWAVNIPAERAAIAALNDWGHIRKTRKMVEKERERLLSELRLLPGVEPFPSFANFVFIKLTTVGGPVLTEKLGLRGILIRDCSSFFGVRSRYVRIAVRTRRENERLVKALREILIP
jgi:threonine-phosphate decarboxylase